MRIHTPKSRKSKKILSVAIERGSQPSNAIGQDSTDECFNQTNEYSCKLCEKSFTTNDSLKVRLTYLTT